MPIPYAEVVKKTPEPIFQLTVVTVCWNALADLKPTLESVLAQKAKGTISIEHVIVDGASTDGTPEWLAEQLAAGNIEQYVSEPDRGIYDAMNKGINLARGQVLAFLNAGDTYTDEDLAPCVLPICRGEVQSVAACANRINSRSEDTQCPNYVLPYLHTPCNHQAFFAAAARYRELGGYDTAFKCCADANIMHRMYRQWGLPRFDNRFVVNFPDGGVSTNCEDDFRHEKVELLWRNWDLIEQQCTQDADFQKAMEAFLADLCYQFRDWQRRHGISVPDELGKLQSMCRKLARQAHSLYAKCALRWLAGRYLPVLIAGRECSALRLRMARFWIHACYISKGNKYSRHLWVPNKPLGSHPLLKRFFPSD